MFLRDILDAMDAIEEFTRDIEAGVETIKVQIPATRPQIERVLQAIESETGETG